MKLLLNTTICIYLIKNNPPGMRSRFEEFTPGDIGVSVITVAELQFEVAKGNAVEKNAHALEAFLLPLETLPFDLESCLAYGKIRSYLEQRGEPMGSLDALMAAQAVAHRLKLVTNNLREFARVPGLVCENWVSVGGIVQTGQGINLPPLIRIMFCIP